MSRRFLLTIIGFFLVTNLSAQFGALRALKDAVKKRPATEKKQLNEEKPEIIDTTTAPFPQSTLKQAPKEAHHMSYYNNMLKRMPGRLVEIDDKKAFHNTFGVAAEKVMTAVNVNKDSLITGNMIMQFFSRAEDFHPVALYWGMFKNGYADGYGIYVEKFNQGTEVPFTIRKGLWRQGVFLQEQEAVELAKQADSRMNYKRILDIADFHDKQIIPVGITLDPDPLNPLLANRLEVTFIVRLTMRTVQWALFTYLRPDFMSEDSVYFTDANPFLKEGFQNFRKDNMVSSLLGPALNDFKSGHLGEMTYNDYTKLYLSPWFKIGSKACDRTYEEKVNDPLENYMRYSTERYRNITVYFRKDMSSPYQEAGTETLYEEEFCDKTYAYYINDHNVSLPLFPVRKSFNTQKQANDFIVREFSRSNEVYEEGIKDADKRKRSLVDAYLVRYNAKVSAIFDRIEQSELYNFHSSDTLAGAWYSEKDNRIYLKSAGESKMAFLPLTYSSILNPEGYQNALTLASAADLLGISEMTKNEVRFKNGRIWKRISSEK